MSVFPEDATESIMSADVESDDPGLAAAWAGEWAERDGYGASDKPAERDADTYSKRTIAAEVVTLARKLGHEHFALAGHDRGTLVAIRAGLDHPDAITHLAALDVLPTLVMWDILHGANAGVAFHLYLMAQPPGLPEQMISASADAFFGYFLDAWAQNPQAIPADVRVEYLEASREAVPSIAADYRASAGIDIAHDQADRAAGYHDKRRSDTGNAAFPICGGTRPRATYRRGNACAQHWDFIVRPKHFRGIPPTPG